jgi:hypothetical protein
MYSFDGQDRVVELEAFRAPNPDAPYPSVRAAQRWLALTYSVADLTDEETQGLHSVVKFEGVQAHSFRAASRDTLSSHPLRDRGLVSDSVQEVLDSSWIREWTRERAGDPSQGPDHSPALRHVIFTFRHSIFECLCTEWTDQVMRAVWRDEREL